LSESCIASTSLARAGVGLPSLQRVATRMASWLLTDQEAQPSFTRSLNSSTWVRMWAAVCTGVSRLKL
jgi:hypothetical protein